MLISSTSTLYLTTLLYHLLPLCKEGARELRAAEMVSPFRAASLAEEKGRLHCAGLKNEEITGKSETEVKI